MEWSDVGALSAIQIRALVTAGFNALTAAGSLPAISPAALGALTTTQIAGLSTGSLNALTSVQFGALSTAQVAALTTSQIASLTASDVAALSGAQLSAMGARLGSLSFANVGAMNSAAVQTLTTSSIAVLGSNINAWGSAQVMALTTAEVAALSTSQIATLSTFVLRYTGTAGVQALSTQQVSALTTLQVSNLTPWQAQALSTNQLRVLTTSQVEALKFLTPTQVAALTTQQLAAYETPIVLDLNGDGVQTLNLSQGVAFDLKANGRSVQTGWVSASDGLLVRDHNQDGRINDGSELFGSATQLADGTTARDGYQALSELDTNLDGTIDKADAAFSSLAVWVDSNSDGVSQAQEIKHLDALGITSLSLQTNTQIAINQGNVLGLNSSYQTADGATHAAADVWFAVAPTAGSLGSKVSAMTQAISDFAEVPKGKNTGGDLGVGNNLLQAMQSYAAYSPTQMGATGIDDLRYSAAPVYSLAPISPSSQNKAQLPDSVPLAAFQPGR
jgi:hypothetical protein